MSNSSQLKITFSDGICSANGCKNEGLLLCNSCRLVEYCGATCQKQDWKHRHKAECKALKNLQHTITIKTSQDLDSARLFYFEKPVYKDRLLIVMNLIMGEKQKSSEGLSIMELFLRTEAICKILEYRIDINLSIASVAKLEGHISNATACLQEMMRKTPSTAKLLLPLFEDLGPQDFFAIFKARILFAEAKVLLSNSRRLEAEALCDQAMESVKTMVENVDTRIEYLTRFCDFLNHFDMMEKKKNFLEYVYCTITEKSGLADPRLPPILHNLSIDISNSGDLETAELYRRTALESLTSHCETKDIAVHVATKLSLGMVLLERCRAICKQQKVNTIGTTGSASCDEQESSIAALIEEAGAEFKSGVTLCEEEGQLGAPHLSIALNFINNYYLLCGFTGDDVEASMWRAVRLDPALYPKGNGHDAALLMLGQYYRQQCDVMGSSGTIERPLERLLELRKFTLNAIERLPEQERDLYQTLHNVVDTVAKPYMRLSLWGRSITDDPKAYMVAADQAIRRWQELPAVANSLHNATKLEEARRLSRVHQEIAVMVSIALACRLMSAEDHERTYRFPGTILWRKGEAEANAGAEAGSSCQACHGTDDNKVENCAVCASTGIHNQIGDTERRAIHTLLNPRAKDLLQRAFSLCQDNFSTEDALVSDIARYLKTEEF